jgi:hypothetical protein
MSESMKKILEVLESSNGELKFYTDVDVKKNPAAVMDVASSAVFTMATKLWGGQEDSVIAVIRALFVADMALSVDPRMLIHGLAQESERMAEIFNDMMSRLVAEGKAQTFGPGVKPPSGKPKS